MKEIGLRHDPQFIKDKKLNTHTNHLLFMRPLLLNVRAKTDPVTSSRVNDDLIILAMIEKKWAHFDIENMQMGDEVVESRILQDSNTVAIKLVEAFAVAQISKHQQTLTNICSRFV